MEYQSVLSKPDDAVQTAVLMETSFAEVSFPTVVLPVHSYIGDMMAEEAPEALENFGLEPFEMKVQGLDRTLADKVFAICDYYIQDRVKSIHATFTISISCFRLFHRRMSLKHS